MAELQQKLTLTGLTMIAIGCCIGTGIFLVANKIAQVLPHPSYILLVWLLGGIIALTGALTFAELGGMFPKSGGVYVFLREAYGDFVGFLYGWVILMVITTGALAALGVGFAEYLGFFLPDLSQPAKMWIAGLTVFGLTLINIFGVHISQYFANFFTGTKLIAIAGIIIAGVFFAAPNQVELNFALTENVPVNLASGMLVALVGVLFSVGGWHHASYLSGEAVDAQRTVPRAMILGVLIVTITYLLINLSYMMLLPLEAIQSSSRVAGDAIATLIPWGGKLVAVIITISIFGTIGIYTVTAPRIYFAMAQDGIFFKGLGYVHPKYKTPVYAMLLQVIWAIVILIFWDGLFQEIINYVVFMDILFMTLAGASIFIFRKKRPNVLRPYKTWGYPLIPAIFVLISTAFLINTFLNENTGKQAIAGLVFLGLGSLVYLLFKKR